MIEGPLDRCCSGPSNFIVDTNIYEYKIINVFNLYEKISIWKIILYLVKRPTFYIKKLLPMTIYLHTLLPYQQAHYKLIEWNSIFKSINTLACLLILFYYFLSSAQTHIKYIHTLAIKKDRGSPANCSLCFAAARASMLDNSFKFVQFQSRTYWLYLHFKRSYPKYTKTGFHISSVCYHWSPLRLLCSHSKKQHLTPFLNAISSASWGEFHPPAPHFTKVYYPV